MLIIRLLKLCVMIASMWAFIFCAYASDNEVKVEMRNHGYTLGDVMPMQATFNLKPSEQIDKDSLPLPGRVTPWLDIQSITMQQHEQQVSLFVKWQLFATVEMTQMLQTPEMVLKTTGKNRRSIVIPKQNFYYSPVLPMPPLKDINRRSNEPALLFNTVRPLVTAIVCLVLAIVCYVVRLWLSDRIPWLPYQPGPMTNLVRGLKRQTDNNTQVLTQHQLRDIHTALNKCAGCSLYPEDLSALFQHAPYFAPERKDIEQFFHDSWASFYQSKQEAHGINFAKTMAWIKRVAIAERLYWRNKNTTANTKLLR